MTTPHKPEASRPHRGIPSAGPRAAAVWRVLECLGGGIIAVVFVLLALPVLADMTRPLELLSTTALVAVLIFAWLIAWALVGMARQRLWTTLR